MICLLVGKHLSSITSSKLCYHEKALILHTSQASNLSLYFSLEQKTHKRTSQTNWFSYILHTYPHIFAMEAHFIYVILTCFAVGFISNFLTLLYIVNSFNIRTHVFLLIFIDTLFSTSCCFVGVILYVFIAAEVIEINFIFCTLSFFVSYIPTNSSLLQFAITWR